LGAARGVEVSQATDDIRLLLARLDVMIVRAGIAIACARLTVKNEAA
jgi:hypothetical protein